MILPSFFRTYKWNVYRDGLGIEVSDNPMAMISQWETLPQWLPRESSLMSQAEHNRNLWWSHKQQVKHWSMLSRSLAQVTHASICYQKCSKSTKFIHECMAHQYTNVGWLQPFPMKELCASSTAASPRTAILRLQVKDHQPQTTNHSEFWRSFLFPRVSCELSLWSMATRQCSSATPLTTSRNETSTRHKIVLPVGPRTPRRSGTKGNIFMS